MLHRYVPRTCCRDKSHGHVAGPSPSNMLYGPVPGICCVDMSQIHNLGSRPRDVLRNTSQGQGYIAGHIPGICCIDMLQGYAAWTCRKDMLQGHVSPYALILNESCNTNFGEILHVFLVVVLLFTPLWGQDLYCKCCV